MPQPASHCASIARPVCRPGLLRAALLALVLALCGALAAPVSPAAVEQDSVSVARSVKAAFLYKFLGYVEFPAAALAEPGAPFAVGVVGADDLAAELARITVGRNVAGRGIAVRVVHDGEPLAGLQMLFVDGAEAARPALLRAAQQLGILTVTEADNGLQMGSVINFRLVEDRIRFEVSLEAADKSGLKLSSRLLAVAYHVRKDAP